MKNPNREAERRAARLIAFGVILYAAVMNLSKVESGLQAILSTLTPIIVGCVVALILDVPVHGFENLLRNWTGRAESPETPAQPSLWRSPSYLYRFCCLWC